MMTRLVRYAAAAAIAAFASAASAEVSSAWHDGDYPAEPPRPWTVELARFPSEFVAQHLLSALQDAGMAPLSLEVASDGSAAVALGAVADAGEAWYIAEEIRAAKIAEARVAPLETTRTASSLAPQYPAMAPFAPTPGMANDATPDSVRDEVARLAIVEGDASLKSHIEEFLSLWKTAQVFDPRVGEGAVLAAERLWTKRIRPEECLYLAGKVARGEWTASPASRMRAQEIASELLYGHRRDWRAAWSAARALESTAGRTEEQRAMDRVRLGALLVELAADKRLPGFGFSHVRQYLRRAAESAPASARLANSRLQLIYLQTFAWEGNWARVEEVARDLVAKHPEDLAAAATARILLARSLERKRDWDGALEQLSIVQTAGLPSEHHFRLGMELVDPLDELRPRLGKGDGLLSRFRRLKEGLDPNTGNPVQPATFAGSAVVAEDAKLAP